MTVGGWAVDDEVGMLAGLAGCCGARRAAVAAGSPPAAAADCMAAATRFSCLCNSMLFE